MSGGVSVACDVSKGDVLEISVDRSALHLGLKCPNQDEIEWADILLRDPDKIRALRDACDEALQQCSGS